MGNLNDTSLRIWLHFEFTLIRGKKILEPDLRCSGTLLVNNSKNIYFFYNSVQKQLEIFWIHIFGAGWEALEIVGRLSSRRQVSSFLSRTVVTYAFVYCLCSLQYVEYSLLFVFCIRLRGITVFPGAGLLMVLLGLLSPCTVAPRRVMQSRRSRGRLRLSRSRFRFNNRNLLFY